MLKKIILSAVCATATLTIAEPALASGVATGCSAFPPHLIHLCQTTPTPPTPPVEVPEPSLVIGGIVVAGGCLTRKMTQKNKLVNAG